jgi:hypothetical protein
MCGSNEEQTDAQAQEAEFSRQMMAENAAVYGKQQTILDSLNAGFQSIVAKGPNQEGFSAGEKENFNTEATESVAGSMTKAAKALGNGQAAQGGGDTFIPSGVAQQQREELAEAGAEADATSHQKILSDDYAEGHTNYNNAVAGEETVASDLNPVGYSTATTSANSASADEANAIAAAANSPFTAVMGALGGVAGAATSAYIGKH